MEPEKLSVGRRIYKGAVVSNPVLIQLAGICPAAAVSTDLFTGIFFSAVFTVITVINCFLASLLLKKAARTFRVVFYFFVSLAVICPVMRMLEAGGIGLSEKIGLYLPLLAVNSVTAVHCEQFAVKHGVGESFTDSVSVSIGFSSVMILLSLVREVLGKGTVAGRQLPFGGLPGMLMPFGSFIVLGFFAMFLKWYISRFSPELFEETAVNIKAPQEGQSEGEEELQSVPSGAEFLFGSDPEDELFTEFWVEQSVNSERIVQNIDAISKGNEQFGEQAEKRMLRLLGELDKNLDFGDENKKE